MAFRKPLAVRSQNRGKVGELRHFPAESLINRHLLGRVRDVVVAADHVGDAHQRVVDRDHVVVHRNAGRDARRRADQDGVRDRLGGKFHRPAHQVVEAQRLRADPQPHREGLARGQIFFNFRRAQRPAAAGVDLRLMGPDGRGLFLRQLLGRAEAAVGLALGQQLLGVLGINLQPLGLAIRANVAFSRTFVPVQPQPAQILDQLGLVAPLGAFHVGVFNAQQKLAAGAPRKEPVVERCAGVAHMQQAGGRRSEANAWMGCRHHSLDDRR